MAEIRDIYIIEDRATGPLDNIARAMAGVGTAASQAQAAGGRLAGSLSGALQTAQQAAGQFQNTAGIDAVIGEYQGAANAAEQFQNAAGAGFDAVTAKAKEAAEAAEQFQSVAGAGFDVAATKAKQATSAAEQFQSAAGAGFDTAAAKAKEAARAQDGAAAQAKGAADAFRQEAGQAQKLSTSCGQLATEAARAGSGQRRAAEDAEQLNRRMGQAAQSAKQAGGALRQAGADADSAGRSFQKLWGAVRNSAIVLGGIQAGKKLAGLSDEMTQIRARIDRMNDGLQTTAQLQQAIYQAAQNSRGAFADTADLAGKLGTLAGDAFGSSREIVNFVEQINKHIALSGASAAGAQAAMLQLTQAMSSGTLRGEELNSILEQTPTIAQAIARYMGLSVGQMRELASEGVITADVVKNAMFGAAAETNAQFAKIPLTWEQLWTGFQNKALQALNPLLDGINWAANNMDALKGVFWAVGGAAVVAAIGTEAFRVALWNATTAAGAFFATLLANPLTWVALLVGVVIYALYQWVQSVGGAEIAWLKAQNVLLGVWDVLKIAFFSGVYAVMNLGDSAVLKMRTAGTAIQNIAGDMKAGFLGHVQNMVNGAIDILNGFIRKLNGISAFGKSLFDVKEIGHVSFGSAASVTNNFNKASRTMGLTQDTAGAMARKTGRSAKLDSMEIAFNEGWKGRSAEIAQKQAALENKQFDPSQLTGGILAAFGAGLDVGNAQGVNPYQQLYQDMTGEAGKTNKALKGIGGDVAAIKKEVRMDDETVKFLEDKAQRQYINRVNLTAQTPVIHIHGQNTGDTEADKRAIAEAIKQVLIEQLASSGNLATARP